MDDELKKTEQEAALQIRIVDDLEKQDRAARYWLMVVSRDFKKYGEKEIREAYEKASQIQVDLQVARQKEQQLRQKRDELQLRMKGFKQIVVRAEDLVSRVGVVMDYLSGNLKNITAHLQSWQRRQELAVGVIRAQEEERRRVAREIHDGPAQVLASAVMRLELCEKMMEVDPGRARKELADLKDMVRASLKDVRKIIFDLRPMALDDLGLVPALRTYFSAFEEKTGLHVDLLVVGDERRLPSSIEIAAFRLIQECVNNVHKHAGTGAAVVKVEYTQGLLNISVKDDGVGFDPDRLNGERSERYGLIGMKERVEMLRGEIAIRSRPGEGTRVSMSIPLGEQGGEERASESAGCG